MYGTRVGKKPMHDGVIGLFITRYEFGVALSPRINTFATPPSLELGDHLVGEEPDGMHHDIARDR